MIVLRAYFRFDAELVLGTDSLDLMGVLLLGLVHALQSAAICWAFFNAKRAESGVFSRSTKSLFLFPSSSTISLAILSVLVRLFVYIGFFGQKLWLDDFIDKTFELERTS